MEVTPTVRAARDRLWRMGDIASWKLQKPHRIEIKELLDRAGRELIVLNIARKGWKTTTCSLFCIEQAIKTKQHIRVATAFLSDLQAFLLPIFDFLLNDCPKDMEPVFKESKKEYRFKNGSVIKLVGLDKNRNGLRGNIIDILVVDEAAFVKNLEYLYKSVIIPATKERPFKLIFPSTPPESPEHFWASVLVQKAKERGTYIEQTIDADKDLDPIERQRLLDEVGGEHSPTAQREFFCKIIVDATRAVAPSFSAERHVAPFEEDHIYWMVFCDMGGVIDLHAYHKIGWSHDLRKVLFAQELTFQTMTPSPIMIAAVQEKWPGLPVIMDKPGQTGIDLSAAGMPTADVIKIKDGFGAGIAYLNTHLHNDQVLIHPDCALLIRNLEGGLLTPSRLDHERTPHFGHNDHVACMIYGLRGVDKTRDLRPKPNHETVFYRNKPPAHEEALRGLTHARR